MEKVEKYSISFFYPCIKFPETACVSPIPTSNKLFTFRLSDHRI